MHMSCWIHERANRLENWLCRWGWWLGVLTTIVYLATTWMAASVKLLWFDELITLYISRLPTLADIDSALKIRLDWNPPFYYLLPRLAGMLIADEAVSSRLPSILAFGVMCICIFQFARKYSSPSFAVFAGLLPWAAKFYSYAIEARPYALICAATAFALLSWHAATQLRSRAIGLFGLFLGLAMAVSCHYYATLIFVPIGLGEIVRTVKIRRFDWSVWAALVSGLAPLILFLPVIPMSASQLGSHSSGAPAYFWAKASLTAPVIFYDWLLGRAGFLCVVVVAVVFLCRLFKTAPHGGVGETTEIPIHEAVAVFSLALFPLAAGAAGTLVTGTYTHRYASPAIVGVSILAGLIATASLKAPNRSLAGVLSLLLMAAWLGGHSARTVQRFLQRQPASEVVQIEHRTLFDSLPASTPVAVADPLAYLEMSHYVPADRFLNVVYLSNLDEARRYADATPELTLSRLIRWVPLRLEESARFMAAHDQFAIYSISSTFDFDWLTEKVLRDRYTVQVTRKTGEGLLLTVSRADIGHGENPPAPPAAGSKR
jgi:hypothetical protein